MPTAAGIYRLPRVKDFVGRISELPSVYCMIKVGLCQIGTVCVQLRVSQVSRRGFLDEVHGWTMNRALNTATGT